MPRGELILLDKAGEVAGVFGGKGAGVVVEVGKDIPVLQLAADDFGPGGQLLPAVFVVVEDFHPVEAEVNKVGSWPARRLGKGLGVVPNQAGVVLAEKLKNRRLEPTGVAEFESEARRLGVTVQKLLEAVKVQLEAGRQLPEDNGQFFLERLDSLPKPLPKGRANVEAMKVGQTAGRLDGEAKVDRSAAVPVGKGGRAGEAVEGAVDFQAVKLLAVKFQPLAGRKFSRVKFTPPVGIAKT